MLPILYTLAEFITVFPSWCLASSSPLLYEVYSNPEISWPHFYTPSLWPKVCSTYYIVCSTEHELLILLTSLCCEFLPTLLAVANTNWRACQMSFWRSPWSYHLVSKYSPPALPLLWCLWLPASVWMSPSELNFESGEPLRNPEWTMHVNFYV